MEILELRNTGSTGLLPDSESTAMVSQEKALVLFSGITRWTAFPPPWNTTFTSLEKKKKKDKQQIWVFGRHCVTKEWGKPKNQGKQLTILAAKYWN